MGRMFQEKVSAGVAAMEEGRHLEGSFHEVSLNFTSGHELPANYRTQDF